MIYSNLMPLTLYRGQTTCPLPKGDPVGKGDMVFIVSPSRKASLSLLRTDGKLDLVPGLYKKYYSDYSYYEKIGTKNIRERVTDSQAQEIIKSSGPSTIEMIGRSAIGTQVKNKRNTVIDLGHWHSLYFGNRKKRSPAKLTAEYLDFLYRKIKDSRWDGYRKTIVIDISLWDKAMHSAVNFAADNFNNPITSIFFALYKKPELLEKFRNVDFLFIKTGDSVSFVKVPGSDLINENYGKLKARISSICSAGLDVEGIEDIDKQEEKKLIENGIKSVPETVATRIRMSDDIRKRVVKNFVGDDDAHDVIDATANLDTEVDNIGKDIQETLVDEYVASTDYEPQIDEELSDEIDNAISDYLDENEIESDGEVPDEAITQIANKVASKLYRNTFKPEYNKVKQNRVNRLMEQQEKVIPTMTPKETMESLVIDTTDLDEAVRTPNDEYLHSSYINFDKCYTKKKLDRDIDECVKSLSKGTVKIFCIGKSTEDTSTQVTLKETKTYHLEDENGKKMTVKFDVPKIIENNYLYVNGNMKVLNHQMTIKPIIKHKPDEVKISTHFEKLIVNRKGLEDAIASPIAKYIMKNGKKFETKPGNSVRKNGDYDDTLESSIFAKKIYSFRIDDWLFITSIPDLCEWCKRKNITVKKPTRSKYPIAVNTETKEVMYFDTQKDSYGSLILGVLDEPDILAIKKSGVSKRQYYTTIDIMKSAAKGAGGIPLALIVLHTVGLSEMLMQAGVRWKWVPRENRGELKSYDPHTYGNTELADGFLVWEREPVECGMLMNGVNRVDFRSFTREEMDDKDTMISALTQFYKFSNMSYNLDQYADFMIDDVTREILEELDLPTTYVGLLLLANKMLTTTSYIPEFDYRNLRVRSNEMISQHVYKTLVDAFNVYRKGLNNVHPKPISVKQDAVMKSIMKSSLTENESIINPFFELEKTHAITYHGEGGVNMDRAFTIDKRAYTESMLGIAGITTSNDGKVGINRELTLEPRIVNTRGFVEFTPREKVNDLSAANLLTPGELLTPMGVEHDDPARTAMAVKQSKYMIPIDASEPGMITNGIDRVLPYHLSKEFAIVAEDDGVVVEEKGDLIIVKYNNGRTQAIDRSDTVKKNSSAGFWIVTNMMCDKKKGDKVKKNEVIGYEKTAFQKNIDDLSATMTRGPFVKVALIPRWDCYEDSNPITAKTSDDMVTTMAMEETAVLKANMVVHSIAKVGDKVNSGDPLIRFDQFSEDKEVQNMMNIIRAKLKEDGDEFIENAASTIKAHYTGEIVDIKIYSTVPLEEMSPSMRAIVGEYYEKIDSKIQLLKKYKNPEDNDYYMAGLRLTEYPEPVKADARGLLKGERVDEDGILFCFFIQFRDYIKKGDKITAEFALKGISSQVIEPGLEPYSEYRPDEHIGLIIAPHTPTARKTTGIFKSMFINKLLIEKKRQIMEYWASVRSSIK